MADSPDEYRIKATIDTSGASAGADQLAADGDKIAQSVKGVGGAAEDTTPKISKMLEESGGMRESRRLASELFESMRGGDESIAGLSGILRYVLISSEALAPAGPLGMAIVGIGAALVSLIATHAAHADAATKDATATDAFADANRRLDEILKEVDKDKFWTQELDGAAQVTAQLEEQAKAYKIIQAARDALSSAKLGLEIAKIDKQEADESAKARPDQQDALRAKYEYERDFARNQAEQQKAAAETAQKVADLDRLNVTKQQGQAKVEAGGEGIQRAAANEHEKRLALVFDQSDYQYARDRANALSQQKADAAAGYEGSKALAPKEEIELETLMRAVEGLRQKEVNDGPQYTEQIDRSKDEIKAQEKDEADALKNGDTETAEQARARIDQLNAFVIRAGEYANAQSQTQEAIGASTKTYAEFQKGLIDLNAQIEAANIEIKAARTKQEALTYSGPAKLENDQTKEGDIAQRAKNKAAEDAQKDREARRSAEIDKLEAEIKAATDAAAKGALENQKAAFEAANIRDKADTDFSTGKITKDQRDAFSAKANETQANANTEAQNETDKTREKQAGAQAEAAIKDFGPSKQQAQEAHAAVQELDKGNAQGAQQLGQILSQLVSSAKGLTQSQLGMFQNIMEKLTEVTTELSDHQSQIDRLRHP